MRIDFSNQTVLVTGGTRGIGHQLAEDFANLGAELIITGSNRENIDQLNRKARNDARCKRSFVAVDFSHPGQTDEFMEYLRSRPDIRVCINNAGINRINEIENTKLEDWNDLLAVNLNGPFRVIRELTPAMKKNQYGRIVNVGSIFGLLSKAKRSLYTMTKYGIRGLTVTASIELARDNILVNTISPGFVMTELTKKILKPEEMTALAEQVPIGRFAQPEEISRVALFLASGLNTYMTGQNIIVDGGFVNV